MSLLGRLLGGLVGSLLGRRESAPEEPLRPKTSDASIRFVSSDASIGTPTADTFAPAGLHADNVAGFPVASISTMQRLTADIQIRRVEL